ncbi:spermidine synthase [Candidatus Aerophobetes bacterium]|uniref:Polyamine aminopropyltransferase n=1 Tax=Aerophobetes bacterium TaxID=2030807 RepID=A0A2A4YFJ8_UNCAE|nr:MAG: spermidine synthase [Candidatus Aerophobetes bacterium]
MKRFILFFLTLSIALCSADEYKETLHDAWSQSFEMSEILYHDKTEHQDLIIFQNPIFGKVLALDGVIQLTELDEFIYHEMITHIPVLTHGNIHKVLVIGGGDGGTIRELVKHPGIMKITLAELDEGVIEFSKKYLPSLSNGAFNSPKLHIKIGDAAEFVKTTEEKFDLIICDSTDPIGPGAVLFQEEFYKNCQKCLNEQGIFVSQAGVPFVQYLHDDQDPYTKLKTAFKHVTFYQAAVPTYVGGPMVFTFASNVPLQYDMAYRTIKKRMQYFMGDCKYYNAKIHRASFVLPEYLNKMLYKDGK